MTTPVTCQHCDRPVEFGRTEQGFAGFVHTATGLAACPVENTGPVDADLHDLAVTTDTALADLHRRRADVAQKRRHAVDAIHVHGGDHKQNTHRVRYERAAWGMSLDEAIAATPKPWDVARHAQAVTELATVDADIKAVDVAIATCNQVWIENGRWFRFFMVPGGHIHSSMDCSTCNNGQDPTTFGWLPQLSGLTDAEAVAAHGALLCTVCFPSAPVEWTNGRELEAEAKQAARCPGSGQYVKTERWDVKYARCPECHVGQSRTSTGKLRAHKPPKAAAR